MQKKNQDQHQFLIILGISLTVCALAGAFFFVYPYSLQKRNGSRLVRSQPHLLAPSLTLLENRIQQASSAVDEALESENEISSHLSTLSTLKNQVKNLGTHLEHYNKKRKSVLGAIDSIFAGIKQFVEERLRHVHLIQKDHEHKVAQKMEFSLEAMQEKLAHCLSDISKKEDLLYQRLNTLEEEQKSFARKKEVQEKCGALSSEISNLMTMLHKSKHELTTKIETLVPSSKHAALQKEVQDHISHLQTKLSTLAFDFDEEKKKIFKSLTTINDEQKNLVSKRELSRTASKEEVEKNRVSALHAITKLEHALDHIKNEFSRNVKVTQSDLESFARKEDVHQTMSIAFSSLDKLQNTLNKTKEDLTAQINDYKKNIITKKESLHFASKDDVDKAHHFARSSLQKMQQSMNEMENTLETKIKEHEREYVTHKQTKHFASHKALEQEHDATQSALSQLKTMIASLKEESTNALKKYKDQTALKTDLSSCARKEDVQSTMTLAFSTIDTLQKKLNATHDSLAATIHELEKNALTKKEITHLASKGEVEKIQRTFEASQGTLLEKINQAVKNSVSKKELSHVVTKEELEKALQKNFTLAQERTEHRIEQSIKNLVATHDKLNARFPSLERDQAALKKEIVRLQENFMHALRGQQREFASKSDISHLVAKSEAEKTNTVLFSSINSLQERLNDLKKQLNQSLEMQKSQSTSKKELRNFAIKDDVEKNSEDTLALIGHLEKKLTHATQTLEKELDQRATTFVSKAEFTKNNNSLLATLHSLQRALDTKKQPLPKMHEPSPSRENKKMEEDLKNLAHTTRSSLRDLKENVVEQKKDLSTFIVTSLEEKMKEFKKFFDAEQQKLQQQIASHTSKEENKAVSQKINRVFQSLNEKIKTIDKKNAELAEKLVHWNHQFDLKLEKEKQVLSERFENRFLSLDSAFQEKYQKLDTHLMSTLESKISSTEARLESQINHTFYKLQKQLQDLEYKLALTKKLNKHVDKTVITKNDDGHLSHLDHAISTSNDLSSLIKNTVKKEMYVSEEALKNKETKAKKRQRRLAELLNALTDNED